MAMCFEPPSGFRHKTPKYIWEQRGRIRPSFADRVTIREQQLARSEKRRLRNRNSLNASQIVAPAMPTPEKQSYWKRAKTWANGMLSRLQRKGSPTA